jgi:hypothetical protein
MTSICNICGVDQKYPSILKRHVARKTPCAPIIERDNLSIDSKDKTQSCRYCGRTFTTATSMYRHVRQRCKIANSDEGMEKLLNHTLQRQLAIVQDQNIEMKSQVAAQSAQMTSLTNMVSQLLANSGTLISASPHTKVGNAHATTFIVNNTTQINNTVHIHPWSSEEKLVIPASMLKAAFTENKRLIEYCRLTDEQKTDPEMAAPYVLEALVDLTKRAHADPAARNVYLNPRRADQVMVFDEASWQVRPLVEAIRSIFDSVAGNIHRIIVRDDERRSLPLEVQSSASWIPNLYEDEPEKYTASAKSHMAAHLQNTLPQ